MTKSLQDQLLGAGLINDKKAKQISKENKKAKKQKVKTRDNSLSEAQAAIQEAQKRKQAHDRELNLEIKKQAETKALADQVSQLVERYKLSRVSGDIEYSFKVGKTIKKILVTPQMSEELAAGRLCIARRGEVYDVIPKPIADKIRERDESSIVVYNTKARVSTSSTDADDEYYAQFEIPDDLNW
jgi:uncharacterized protein YaiL (DUF2058 family)